MKPIKEGKVREIYDNGDSLIMVATDRISCFDVILNNVVTKKGTVLTQMSKFWFNLTKDIIPNHMISTDVKDGGNTNNSQLSSFWKRNGSFLRFQELSLKYNLKTPWIKKTGLSSVDLEFVANNLFTIDKVKYFDPEQASANGAAYPIPATYTFQVYLKF